MDKHVAILHMRRGHIPVTSLQTRDIFVKIRLMKYYVLCIYLLYLFPLKTNSQFKKKLSINCRPRFHVDHFFFYSYQCTKTIAFTQKKYSTVWYYKLPSVKEEALIYWNSSSNFSRHFEPFFTSSSRTIKIGMTCAPNGPIKEPLKVTL